ncbi:hypothetical protein CSKR_106148 [Clonorchis sinensis]|uniref:Uncharacterized protein n=1 Tax=Clonorchis sinensis TaxID=79923 RepID=A0A3R7FA38_CLOSI|nr:hypothetical protein CSKR_106148 [Clonorchis sinensis]
MRLTVPNGFRRLHPTPFVFRVVDSTNAGNHYRLGYRYRIERFWMLFTDNSKELVPSNWPEEKELRKMANPITLYIVPEWQGPMKDYAHPHPIGESSFHKALIYVIGFAVSLVSLSAFKFFDWFWRVRNDPTPVSSNRGKCSEWFTGCTGDLYWLRFEEDNSSHSDRKNSSASTFSAEKKQTFSSSTFPIHPTSHVRPQPTFDSVRNTTERKYWRARTVSESAAHHPDAFLSYSPFFWTSATLNCSHFTDGSAQVCVLCWLNSPEGWVFGPTLNNLDRTVYECLDELTRSAACTLWKKHESGPFLLFARSQKVNHQRYGFAIIPVGSHQTHKHVLLRSQCTFRFGSSLKRHSTSLDNPYFSAIGSGPLPKHPRSCGDGAPSMTSPDFTVSQRLKGPERSTGPSSLPQLAPSVLAVIRHHTNIAQSNRPLFSNPDSDNETAACAVPSLRLPSPQKQVQLPVNSWLAKAADLIIPPTSPDMSSQRIQSDPILRKFFSSGSHDSSYAHRSQERGSICSSSTDGFEYDELDCGNVSPRVFHRSATSLSGISIDSEQLRQAEEAQLLHLIETLSSLLHSKREADCSASENVPADQLAYQPTNNATQFRDLARKATDLSSDLSELEEVLDRLNFKLKATRIELHQAENNLGCIWHLNDHLNGSDTESVCALSQTSSESQTSLYPESVGDFMPPQSTTHSLTHPPPPKITYDIQELPSDPDLPQDDNSPHSTSDLNCLTVSESLFTSTDSSEQCHPTVSLSDIDSGFDRSRSMCSSLTSSVVEPKSIGYSISGTLRSTRSARLGRVRRCLTTPSVPTDLVERAELVNEEVTDVQGFLCPELTFDRDGIIDWTERIDACPHR